MAKASSLCRGTLCGSTKTKHWFGIWIEATDGRAFLDELNKFLKAFGHREVRFDIILSHLVRRTRRLYLASCEVTWMFGRWIKLQARSKRAGPTAPGNEEQVNPFERDSKGRYLICRFFPMAAGTPLNSHRGTRHHAFRDDSYFPPFRRILLNWGRAGAPVGVIPEADDVFFLTVDEWEVLADKPEPMSEVVSKRREAFEINKPPSLANVIRGNQEIYTHGTELTKDESGRIGGVAQPGRGDRASGRYPGAGGVPFCKRARSWLRPSPIQCGRRSLQLPAAW